MEKFAKLFETELGQILIMNTANDETNNPEIRFYYESTGLGVCNMSIKFDIDCWGEANTAFDMINEEKATETIRKLYNQMGMK